MVIHHPVFTRLHPQLIFGYNTEHEISEGDTAFLLLRPLPCVGVPVVA
jgi:hypothetical protein